MKRHAAVRLRWPAIYAGKKTALSRPSRRARAFANRVRRLGSKAHGAAANSRFHFRTSVAVCSVVFSLALPAHPFSEDALLFPIAAESRPGLPRDWGLSQQSSALDTQSARLEPDFRPLANSLKEPRERIRARLRSFLFDRAQQKIASRGVALQVLLVRQSLREGHIVVPALGMAGNAIRKGEGRGRREGPRKATLHDGFSLNYSLGLAESLSEALSD